MRGGSRAAILALTVLLAAACSLAPSRTVEDLHTYLLDPELPSADGAPPGRGGSGTLLIGVPRAQAGFDTPRMVYLLRPHEIQYFASSEWADTPARMLTPLLEQALERTGAWRTVVLATSSLRGDLRLDAEHLALQQEFFSKPSRVRVTLRVHLVEPRGQAVVASKQFEAVEDALSDDPYGGVLAANRAVAKLLNEVADWVGAQRVAVQPRDR
ncbi:MAG: ABC-type transport auxiliary lipoprotein family protein [Nitrospirota bacterium]